MQLEEKSGSRKMLKFLGVLDIIFGIAGIIFGIIMFVGGGLGAVIATDSDAQVGAVAIVLVGIIMLVSGLFDLILGILAVRAANNPRRIMPVWVLALISLILNVIGVISGISSGGGSGIIPSIVGLIIAVIVFVIANNVKKEAGR